MVWYFLGPYEYFSKTREDLQHRIENVQFPVCDLQTASELARLFDLCFQQACQAIRFAADPDGRAAADFISPADYLKIGYEKGFITDAEGWITMLEASVSYESLENPDVFWEISKRTPIFAALLGKLEDTLRHRGK